MDTASSEKVAPNYPGESFAPDSLTTTYLVQADILHRGKYGYIDVSELIATVSGIGLSKVVEPSDEALVTRAKTGDRRAFSELVRRHQTPVFRVCYRVLGNREDAKDASQEAFVRAYKKLDSFEGRSSFKTWMLRLTLNVSLNERGRRKENLPLEDWAPAKTPGPEAEAMKADSVARLHRALQVLQPNHRAAVVLHDLEGLTYQEVGESLEVSEGTAKSWAFRGRRRLKDLLT